MSAGMMPAFDLPGEATPGQFGPTMRVTLPREHACAQKTAVSCTGMPSVITMTSGIAASTDSITASLVPAGGTNTTDTSAPGSAIASPTLPNTGTLVPPRSTDWPALRGLVPPTTFVPAAIIRAPCLRPSEPVMPWTMTRLRAVRKIAISCSCRGQAGQLSGAPRRVVHRLYLFDHTDARLGQDPAAFRGVVAVQPDHDRVAHLLAALGEDADRADEPVRHDLGRRAASDVQEVGRAHAAELLAGVGHDVERRHHQAGSIADDPDGTVG